MMQSYSLTMNQEADYILIAIVFLLLVVLVILAYRWRREQHYRKSNQKLQHLLEAMPDMVVIFDSEQIIRDIVNPDKSILFGLEAGEVIGRTVGGIVLRVPEFAKVAAIISENIDKTFQSRKVCSFNYHVSYNNNEYYAEARMMPWDEDKVICFVHDITSHVVAENEATKYKNFLQLVIDHLPLGIFVKDVSDDYRYIYYNQGVRDFYGDDGVIRLGKNDYEIQDPLADEYRLEDDEVLKSDKPVSFERKITDEQGNTRWAIMTKTRLINNDSSRYIIAILVDLTHDRHNAMELENIKNELSIALDAGSLSAWNYDVGRQKFTSLYRETVAQQGLSYSEVLNIAHPEDREKYEHLMKDLVAGNVEKKQEILRFFRGGKYNWFETHAAGIRSTTTGEIIQVVGTEKNITNEIHQKKDLEESKFKTDLVIKSNGIVQWDYDVRSRVFSSPNEDSFMHNGVSYETYFARMHPDDCCLVEEALQRMISNQATSMNIQVRVKLTNPEYRWVDIHAVVFKRDEDGNVIQLTGLRRDITDWKNVLRELTLLRNRAEEANRLKTAFLANMSHEIRTPLNAIVGFSNLIADTEDQDEIREYCRVIEANNELLLRLINDILDLSKIEAGQLEFSYSELRVSELFATLEKTYRLRVKGEVKLICELPGEDCVIVTEKNRLTQVLSNFLANASKFTTEGMVRMGYEHTEDGLRFYVADTGKGIAAENVPHVFERFMKFDSFVQGTGLGLSICQTIVKRLGGQIGVDSELGKGSTFWFTIPVKVNIVKETTIPTPNKSVIPTAAVSVSADQKLILIAEDNDSNYFLLSSILRKNYRIERASDGEEAVHLFYILKPDLIFMDIRMPRMDGLEATAQIRKTDSRIPIIALTANAFDEDRDTAISVGCTDYLTKPVNMTLLSETLAKWLG